MVKTRIIGVDPNPKILLNMNPKSGKKYFVDTKPESNTNPTGNTKSKKIDRYFLF